MINFIKGFIIGIGKIIPGVSGAMLATIMGVYDKSIFYICNFKNNIKAAIKYIMATDRSFSMIPDKQERLNFILASYNAGLGHIYDAMALAEKYGKNKLVWKDNVENFILLKSNEEYFTDPVCKNGYFRGIETYNFVRDIMSRFESYKKKIKL